MRSSRFLLIGLTLIIYLHSVAAVPYLAARQDVSSKDSQTPATTDAESRASSTAAAQTSAAKSQPGRSSTPTASSSIRVTASVVVQAPVTTSSNEPLPSSSADAKSANALPIQPKITPAMAFAGVILLISGIAYTVIGIKNKWLYIFGSAAYLSILAVTVLIVYLMGDSVSNAIQGAFVVAAFLTGLIFGALALVFPDITDGLGCLLGGFCLSMWFLTLREGGLITSTTGRAIFIGAMSLAGYCLSFTHHTRTYGLMASISFAGATATVLGIDCFSRAGLKEFWLYLWNLNPNIFPLFTDTYPITRAMRAELACVVLFSVFGVISQLKLWKIVKERREKNASSRLEREQQSAREEEALGRKIEDNFTKERAQWEATYGDKTREGDSGVGSSMDNTPKTSSSIREKRASVYNSVEMVPLSKRGVTDAIGKQESTGPTVTVSVLQEDEIQPIDVLGNPMPIDKRISTIHSNAPTSKRSSLSASTNDAAKRSSLQPSQLPPVVIPLPFKIPTEEDPQSESGDNASVSAVLESVQESLSNRRRFSKRLSGSALKRFSQPKNSPLEFDFEETTLISHVEDDRSSVAATLDRSDDGISLSEHSPPQSPRHSVMEEGPSATTSNNTRDNHAQNSIKERNGKDMGDRPVGLGQNEVVEVAETGPLLPRQEGIRQSLTISTNPKSAITRPKRSSLSSPALRSDAVSFTAEEEDAKGQPTKSTRSGAPSVTESHTGSLHGALPEKLSKVALSYRTNEWAKHLETAEAPQVDDIAEPESPGVRLDYSTGERPVPVSDEILGTLAATRDSRRVSSEGTAYRNNNTRRSTSNFSKTSPIEPPYSLSRTPSAVASEAVSPSASASQLPNILSPKSINTLLGKRESLVRNRVSSQSFAPKAVSPGIPTAVEDSEDMTLAQRRRQLQHQKPPSTSQQWQQSSRALKDQTQDFNSHQPKRISGSGNDHGKREVLLAGWRESIRDVQPVQAQAIVEKSRRASMMNERRKKEMEKQQRELARQQRESMMDTMMRSTSMQDAHRDAMRRMQAAANKKL